MVIGTGAVTLIGPAAIVAGPALRVIDADGVVVAGGVYLAAFGTLSALYFRWVWVLPALQRLAWFGAAAALGIAAVAATMTATDLVVVAGYGLGAGGLAVVAIALGSATLVAATSLVLAPARLRAVAMMPPSWTAVGQLWFLLAMCEEASGGTWHDRTRRRLSNRVADPYLLQVMPRAMWLAGFRGSPHETMRRTRHLAGFARALAWRIADCTDRSEFLRIRRELAGAAVAVAAGDWTPLPSAEPQTSLRRRALLRRSVVALLLAGSALLLPRLPGVAVTGAPLGSIQIALLVGAVLSLTPLDPASRERILDAFGRQHQQN
jgi:hypothetical protein